MARGVLSRLGTGKLRHLVLKHLWVQESVARGRSCNFVDLTTVQFLGCTDTAVFECRIETIPRAVRA